MRLTVTIPSLAAGGAERVAAALVNTWSARGDEVTVITLTTDLAPFYPLHPGVVHRQIGGRAHSRGLWQQIANNLRRLRRLRRELAQVKPDCAISFIDQVNVLTSWAALGLGCRVIITERVDPAMAPISAVWKRLRDWSYHLADRIVMQTEPAVASLPAFARRRAMVIPNPVAVPDPPRPRPQTTRRVILGVGRLVPQKGFDLLLQSFAHLRNEFPAWDLVILGEGPERARLELLATHHGLGDRVRLPGKATDVASHFSLADLFVLPSRFEGFPNALCEAMSHGLAVIAADCRSGPREIVRDGLDGLLVPVEDVPSLTDAMRRLMSHDDERVRIGARAREISTRFSLHSVVGAWDHVLSAALPATSS